MLLEDLLAALAQAARETVGDDIRESLSAALATGRSLVGADVVALHVPCGADGLLDVRVPPDAAWPPLALLEHWRAEVIDRARPIMLDTQGDPPWSAPRAGIVLPLFGHGGTVGVLGAFRGDRTFAAEEVAGLLLLAQVALSRAEARQVRRHVEAVTTSEVRDRLAREIHDGPLQRLSGLILHLRHARAGDGEALREAVQWLEAELEATVRQTRQLIHTLRLADAGTTLEERIRAALARLGQTRGLAGSLQWQIPEGTLPSAAADQLFQVINEALANIYRHAAAKRVDVVGRVYGGAVEVTVRDDGIGFDVAKGLRHDIRRLSFGLLSMQERIAALGGTLTLRSQSGRGTRVLIHLPLGQLHTAQNA
ncbi:MAG: GAF domain-containing sensor histidine kinase [Armatimonadota bacterium]|nr:GAF domain-containing sensor histidine kinase [Armatimonadota bacterium]